MESRKSIKSWNGCDAFAIESSKLYLNLAKRIFDVQCPYSMKTTCMLMTDASDIQTVPSRLRLLQ